jgi:predicted anti-sigma-YlaC factor YlaD
MNNLSHCHTLLQSLSDYIDGELESELCIQLEQHLDGCEDCRIVVNTLTRTIDLYRANSEKIELPEDVRLRLYTNLKLLDITK